MNEFFQILLSLRTLAKLGKKYQYYDFSRKKIIQFFRIYCLYLKIIKIYKTNMQVQGVQM